MLRAAGLVPSTFNVSELNEEEVSNLLDAGMEVLRMIKEGDSSSDNSEARALYRTYFA